MVRRTDVTRGVDSGTGSVNVQRLLKGGREMVVGFTSDPSYGPVMMFGLGRI